MVDEAIREIQKVTKRIVKTNKPKQSNTLLNIYNELVSNFNKFSTILYQQYKTTETSADNDKLEEIREQFRQVRDRTVYAFTTLNQWCTVYTTEQTGT